MLNLNIRYWLVDDVFECEYFAFALYLGSSTAVIYKRLYSFYNNL